VLRDRPSRRDTLRIVGMTAAGVLFSRGGASAGPEERKRAIPSSGEEIPVVGLGTWQTFDVGSSRVERGPLEEVLARFAQRGGRVVDSSPMYGRSEGVVGDLAATLGLAGKLFLATKVWTGGKKAGVEQMENSERLLRTKRIDLMQVHNLVDVDMHLATLRDWKAKGRIRYLGVTHYTASAYPEIERVLRREKLDFVQVNFSLAERGAEQKILPLAADRGVAVLANRPFGGGEALRRLNGRPLPEWAAELDCASWAQFFLKWILGHPAVTCVIPATSKVEHLDDNMSAGLGRLPDEEMRRRMVEAY
jgi:diketogulonate reductase-like aldo/keto reductase